MTSLGTFTVTINDQTHTVDWQKIDLVRFEQQFEKTSGALDGMTDQYRMAWIASRRNKIDGTPETFDGFLDLSPDVDLDVEEEAEGKDGGKTNDPPITG